MRLPCLFLLVSCGQPEALLVTVQDSFALTQAQKDACPRLPQLANAGRVQARLEVELDDMARTKLPPCPMTIGVDGDALTVSGTCQVPKGGLPLFRLIWFTSSPSDRQVTLARTTGKAQEGWDERRDSPLRVDPQEVRTLVPKTKGTIMDPPAEKDLFNCDRSGTNTCDSSATMTSSGADADTCSNLQELCADTLFAASVDRCD